MYMYKGMSLFLFFELVCLAGDQAQAELTARKKLVNICTPFVQAI